MPPWSMNRYVIFLVTICSSLEIIKHKFNATAHHCTYLIPCLSSQRQLSKSCLQWGSIPLESPQSGAVLDMLCRSGKPISICISLQYFPITPIQYIIDSFFFSSPPHNMFCYPAESKWHSSSTGPPKPSIEFVHQSGGQVQHWQTVITTFLSGNNVLHITWILNKKNLEISQRMGH